MYKSLAYIWVWSNSVKTLPTSHESPKNYEEPQMIDVWLHELDLNALMLKLFLREAFWYVTEAANLKS